MSEPKRTRLVFLGFAEEMTATFVLDVIKHGIEAQEITVENWAMVHKAEGGKLTITTDKSKAPGAGRGALVGGGAGLVLAVVSGPIGVGAVAAGAAIGAVTAKVKDSGFKNDDIVAVSHYMADGRTGLMIGVPLDQVDAWDAFVAAHAEFESADARHTADIVPGRDLELALEEYVRTEEE